MVPPFNVRILLVPPNELFPLTMTVPAFNVNPKLVAFKAFPCAPISHVPAPLLIKPALLAEVDQFCACHVNVLPVPILKVRAAVVVSVPPGDTVTVAPSATVIFPTVVVKNVTVELALKTALDPNDHAVVKGAAPVLLQLEPVQLAFMPSILQYCWAWIELTIKIDESNNKLVNKLNRNVFGFLFGMPRVRIACCKAGINIISPRCQRKVTKGRWWWLDTPFCIELTFCSNGEK